MSSYIKLLITLFFLTFSTFGLAQVKTVTDNVTDSDGLPFADAYVERTKSGDSMAYNNLKTI